MPPVPVAAVKSIKNAAYFLDYKITNALVKNRREQVIKLIEELAPIAGTHIDIFNRIVEKLAFYDYRTPLAKAMQHAWPAVESSTKIVPWGIDEFARTTTDYSIFDYIETHPEVMSQDPEFVKIAESYIEELDNQLFKDYLQRILGEVTQQWTRDDFEMHSKQSKSKKANQVKKTKYKGKLIPETGKSNLYQLSLEFLHYLFNNENVPYIRGEIARNHIIEYLLQRDARELVVQPSMLESAYLSGNYKSPKQARPEHILCPDSATLDVYLGSLKDLMFLRRYIISALLEQIPAWLRFLEACGLLDPEKHSEAIEDIRENIIRTILKLWKNNHDDPLLYQRLVEIWGDDD